MSEKNVNQYETYKDEDVLDRLYNGEKMSMAEIGEAFGVDQRTVKYWMDKFGIESRSRSQSIANSYGPPTMQTDHLGYEVFKVSCGKEFKTILHHRLLAMLEYDIDEIADVDVHHKNGVPWDNRAENLEVMARSAHASYHSTGRADEMSDRASEQERTEDGRRFA